MASSLRFVLVVSVMSSLTLLFPSEGARESVMFSKVTTAQAKTLPESLPAETAQTVRPDSQTVALVNAHDTASESTASQSTAATGSTESYGENGKGLSDTRFLEGGKYFYDISNAERSSARDYGVTADSEKESSWNAQTFENTNGYGLSSEIQTNRNFNPSEILNTESGTSYNVKGEGISDTRSMEGGKYFYDASNANTQYDAMDAERKSEKNLQTADNYNEHGLLSEDQSSRDFRGSDIPKGQGLSDTRSMDGARYFYDIRADEQKNTQLPQYASLESSSAEDESSSSYFQKENSEPERYVFDTMEEYEKYMENRPYKP